jgi:hypothetical protein
MKSCGGNLISFGSDNANVMVGRNKGLYSHLLEKNAAMHLSGCALHLVHIAAEKGANALPVAVDDILIDIYHMKKSSKRLHNLGMLKHVCTRWLSIDRCLQRLLDNWAQWRIHTGLSEPVGRTHNAWTQFFNAGSHFMFNLPIHIPNKAGNGACQKK